MHALITLSSLLLFGLPAAFAQPDLILHGGKIVTVDDRFTIHQAIAIKDERIIAVGGNDAILQSRGPQTRLMDLRGQTVLPGLIDSHVHPGAAMTEFDHPIPDMESIADVLAYIRARAKVVKEGEWIVLSQVFITRLREQRYPTRQELDEAAPKHPLIFRTGPDCALNSLGLKKAGIDRDSKVPEGAAGRIERDGNGEFHEAESRVRQIADGDRDLRAHAGVVPRLSGYGPDHRG
jgi:predicted amidohydrolase YtcJ